MKTADINAARNAGHAFFAAQTVSGAEPYKVRVEYTVGSYAMVYRDYDGGPSRMPLTRIISTWDDYVRGDGAALLVRDISALLEQLGEHSRSLGRLGTVSAADELAALWDRLTGLLAHTGS